VEPLEQTEVMELAIGSEGHPIMVPAMLGDVVLRLRVKTNRRGAERGKRGILAVGRFVMFPA